MSINERMNHVVYSPSTFTRKDFEDMLDILDWNQTKLYVFYDVYMLHPFGLNYERQTTIHRRYFKAFGQHYMHFKDQWYSYNPKNGRTTMIEKPEFAHDL